MSVFIDFHVLQTVPPCCVNRDDMGSPKTAVYGGAVRARVSSQAWKRAMREEFKTLFDEYDLGIRTKNMVEMVGREIIRLDSSISADECHKKAVKAIECVGIKLKDEKAEALFFMSNKQARAIAELAVMLDPKDKETPKRMKASLKENPSGSVQ